MEKLQKYTKRLIIHFKNGEKTIISVQSDYDFRSEFNFQRVPDMDGFFETHDFKINMLEVLYTEEKIIVNDLDESGEPNDGSETEKDADQ